MDHFSTINPNNTQKADFLQLGMADHDLVYGIRKMNAWWVKSKDCVNGGFCVHRKLT